MKSLLKHNRGFTLIELLVVISIIALLISVLLPALGSARETAKVTQSLVNIRSLTQSLVNYSADNKNRLMNYRHLDNNTSSYTVYWGWKIYDGYLNRNIATFFSPLHPIGDMDSGAPGNANALPKNIYGMIGDGADAKWSKIHYGVNYNGAIWTQPNPYNDPVNQFPPRSFVLEAPGTPRADKHLLMMDVIDPTVLTVTPALTMASCVPTDSTVSFGKIPYVVKNKFSIVGWMDGHASLPESSSFMYYSTGELSGTWVERNNLWLGYVLRRSPFFDVRFPINWD